jgi:Alpha/beta hydrolase domain
MKLHGISVAGTWLSAVAVCVFVSVAFIPLTAEAAINSVTVAASRDYEHADGYTYAEITIHGSIARADGSAGQYSVPAIIIYPTLRRGNRVGVVDWVNSAFYHFFPPTTEFATFQFTLLATGNFLFEEGYTYLSIQWNKAVTEIFGSTAPLDGQPHNHLVYGSIDRSADAWEILLDAARLLKDPRAYPDSHGPWRVTTVLSSGYSQGAGAQLEFLAEGLDPARVYDGHLIQMIGLACWKREDVAPHFGFFGDCSPLPTSGNHAPVIVLESETDMLIYHPAVLGFGKSAFFTRNPANPNWRQYETAAVSHLPESILPLGLPNQNNADARPVFRAAFDNLTRWTHGEHRIIPPPARYFEGGVDATDTFIPAFDADGHFAGGLRLPHVESEVHGQVAGAPLGNFTPLNPLGLDPFHPFVFISGTFTRFTDDQLVARYSSRHEYVKRVKRAADHLAAAGYITDDDRKALIAAAEDEPLFPDVLARRR